MKESDLSSVTDTDGGLLIGFHGGRHVISQLTNTSGTTPRTPQFYNGLNSGLLDNTTIGSIAALGTWTGEIVALGVPAGSFDGDTSFEKLYQTGGTITIDTEVEDLAFSQFYKNF